MKEARKRNIVVSNSAAYCSETVAEHTIGLMLNAARLSSRAEKDLRKGVWQPTQYKGKELFGKTLGILGYGSIGKKVGEIASKGLNMKILYIDDQSSRNDLEKLLKGSDVVAVELPLNDETRGFLGKEEFNLMKEDIIVVNTGRGAVIDEKALVENLKSGKIFAAGIDVFAKEPIDKNNPLLKFQNVTLTPHIAFNTQESQKNLSKIVVDNIIAFIKGKPINVVN